MADFPWNNLRQGFSSFLRGTEYLFLLLGFFLRNYSAIADVFQ